MEATSPFRTWSCGAADSPVWSLESSNPLKLRVAYSNGDKQDKGLRSVFNTLVPNYTNIVQPVHKIYLNCLL